MNSRLIRALLCVIGMLLVANLLRPATAQTKSPATPDVLRAQMIELVDAAGRRRASLKVEADGETLLRLFDERGTIRVKLGAGLDGSGLILMDNNTEPAVHVLARGDAASIALSAPKKAPRVIEP